jgi:hypothetical protein
MPVTYLGARDEHNRVLRPSFRPVLAFRFISKIRMSTERKISKSSPRPGSSIHGPEYSSIRFIVSEAWLVHSKVLGLITKDEKTPSPLDSPS